jgi:glycosyltransferase involved in cell wall biosynthesis
VKLGFSSVDRHDPAVRRKNNTCVHIAGRSVQKGTLALNRVWARHPEWPTLFVYSQKRDMDIAPAANIRWVDGFLDDRELRRVQNTYSMHLCPSEAEGWGHYIVEAMSCKAVVVTTDAPPMNEIVVPSRGVLVPYNRIEPQGLGKSYYVDEGALEEKIAEVLRMGPRERDSLGENAREWYTENDLYFRERLKMLLEKIADLPGVTTTNDRS